MTLTIRQQKTILVLVSVLAAALVAGVATTKQRIYFSKFSFFKDPSEYLYNDIESYRHLETKSKVEVTAEVAKANFRNPIRSIIPVIFYPPALASPYGHLLTSIPYLILFLCLSSFFVLDRFGTLSTAVAYIALFCSLPFLYNTFYGFATYWLDLHASFLFVSSMLLVIRYYEKENVWYLIAFGLVCSLEVLGRYNNAVNIFFGALPILAFILIRRKDKKVVLIHYAMMGATILVLAVPFLVGHLSDNLDYANLGYGLSYTLSDAIRFFVKALRVLAGVKVLAGCAFLFFLFYALFFRWLKSDRERFVLTLWIAVSNFVLLHVVLHNGAHVPSLFYILNSFTIFVIAPFSVKMAGAKEKMIFTAGIVLISCFFLAVDFSDFRELSNKDKSLEKIFNEAILKEVHESGDDRVAGMLGGFSVANVSLENYYAGGSVLPNNTLFAKFDVAWVYYYHTKDTAEIRQQFLKSLEDLSGVAAVYADTASLTAYFDRTAKIAACDISRKMAIIAMDYFPRDSSWEFIQNFDHSVYGRISLFRKRTKR